MFDLCFSVPCLETPSLEWLLQSASTNGLPVEATTTAQGAHRKMPGRVDDHSLLLPSYSCVFLRRLVSFSHYNQIKYSLII